MVSEQSNFQRMHTEGAEVFKPCNRPGFNHYLVSNYGKVVNMKRERREVRQYFPNAKSRYTSVALSPQKGFPNAIAFQIAVPRLVYEAHHNVILEGRVDLKFKNGDTTDYRIGNIIVPSHKLRALPAVTINLPVIRPESTTTPPPEIIPARPLSSREQKAIDYYNNLIAEARDLLTCSGAMHNLAEFEALELSAIDLVEVLDGMSVADVAALILNVVKMARAEQENE